MPWNGSLANQSDITVTGPGILPNLQTSNPSQRSQYVKIHNANPKKVRYGMGVASDFLKLCHIKPKPVGSIIFGAVAAWSLIFLLSLPLLVSV